jgi:hypothetical protein
MNRQRAARVQTVTVAADKLYPYASVPGMARPCRATGMSGALDRIEPRETHVFQKLAANG